MGGKLRSHNIGAEGAALGYKNNFAVHDFVKPLTPTAVSSSKAGGKKSLFEI